jgi:arginine exporter protein ArgO
MINSEKLGKILQWAGLVGLSIIGVKTFKAHKKECLESEKREEEAKKQRIVDMGLLQKERFKRSVLKRIL